MSHRRSLLPLSFAATACLLALTLPGTNGVAQAEPRKKVDLSGEWKCEGWGPGTSTKKKAQYETSVVVEAKGNDTYLITWKTPDGKDGNKGVGIYDPKAKVFAAGYSVGDSPGVAIYTISKRGKVMFCRGTFTKMAGRVAHERWTRKK